jgi:hypothetical protein
MTYILDQFYDLFKYNISSILHTDICGMSSNEAMIK